MTSNEDDFVTQYELLLRIINNDVQDFQLFVHLYYLLHHKQALACSIVVSTTEENEIISKNLTTTQNNVQA